jgi:uncharacterized protein YdgA (DUF945 family)
MKKIIVVVVVLALLLGVAPWGIGQLAEKRVNAGLDQLVQQAPYLTIVDRKWTRGWFRSEQEVTFEVLGPLTRALNAGSALVGTKQPDAAPDTAPQVSSAPVENPAAPTAAASTAPGDTAPADGNAAKPLVPPLRFSVRNEILHGPVLWPAGLGIARVNSKLVLSDEIRKKIVEVFGTDEPLRISTRVGFFGGGTTRFAGDGRTVKLKDKPTSISYDDFKLDIGYSKNFDSLDADGKLPRFEVDDTGKGESAVIKDIYLAGNTERVQGDIYDGGFKFGIGEMRVVASDKAETLIEGVHYVVDSKVNGEFMDVQAKLGSGKVRTKELADLKFDIDEIHYDFSLHRLHIATLQKLAAAMKKVYSQPLNDSAELNAAFTGPFKQYGLQLLQHDPEYVIDRMGIVTPEGEGVIKGVLRLKGVTEADFAGDSAKGLLAKLEADLTIEIAQKLIEKIPNGNTGAGAAIDQGYARREGDKIVSHIEFKQGSLKINDKPVPIPGLGPPTAQPTSQE